MLNNRSPWQYHFNNTHNKKGYNAYDRQKLLNDCPHFIDIIQAVNSDMKNIELLVEYGNAAELKKRTCKRASWYFDIKPQTFDLLFNSINGIRGQYYIGADYGIAQNQLMIATLQNTLINQIKFTNLISQHEAALSLSHIWARFWIDEAHAQWQEDVEIQNDWIAHPELGNIGIEAPTGTKVYINGAWIDANGQAYLYSKKKNRSYDIFRYGFS